MTKRIKMSKAGSKIISAMEDALEYARGDTSKGNSYTVYPSKEKIPELLKNIRSKLNMSRIPK